MADVINLDENSGSVQNPKQDSDTQNEQEQSTQSKSQISQKFHAVAEKFGGYVENFQEILKTNKVLGIGIIAVLALVFYFDYFAHSFCTHASQTSTTNHRIYSHFAQNRRASSNFEWL